MKKIEWILLVIALIGVILKFAFIPGGSILFTISLVLLSIVYFYLGFALYNNIKPKTIFQKQSYSGISTLKIVGSVLAGMSLSTIIIGMVFRLQHWPGSGIAILSGLCGALVLLVILSIKYFSKRNSFYRQMIIRTTIIIVVALPLIIFSPSKIEKYQYRNYPDYIKAYEKYIDDPSNDELKEQLYLEHRKVTMKEEEYKQYIEWYEKQKDQE